MSRNYVELLHHGNKAQLEKLLENAHKNGWNELPVEDFFVLLQGEVRELFDAISGKDKEEIRREAADVANFAHMIIYQCVNGE